MSRIKVNAGELRRLYDLHAEILALNAATTKTQAIRSIKRAIEIAEGIRQ